MSSQDLNKTLLAPSMVRLIGRVLSGLAQAGGAAQGAPGQVNVSGLGDLKQAAAYQGQSQLVKALTHDNLRLAHIFGFTHEGRYTPMHVPALFLVHSDGEPVREKPDQDIDPARLGLAHLEKGNLTFASDLRFWAYDRGDETIRLDVSTGTLLQLVIDAETGNVGGQGRRVDLFGQEGSVHARLSRGSY